MSQILPARAAWARDCQMRQLAGIQVETVRSLLETQMRRLNLQPGSLLDAVGLAGCKALSLLRERGN